MDAEGITDPDDRWEYAWEEVVCNSAASFLQDEAVLQDLVAQDRTLMQQVADYIRQFLDELTQTIQSLGKDMSELNGWRQMEALKHDHESLQNIYESLTGALAQTNEQDSQDDLKYSLWEDDATVESADGLLTEKQWAKFYGMISEIKGGKAAQFEKTKDGKYILAIEDKLIYTDGNYDNPSVEKVIEISLDSETHIDFTRYTIYGVERGESYDLAREVFENLYGEKDVARSYSIVHKANARQDGRGEGSHRKEARRGTSGVNNSGRYGSMKGRQYMEAVFGKPGERTERQKEAAEFADEHIKRSLREEEPPKKTIKGYKVFAVFPNKPGELYPPMVANPGGAATPVGVWLNADAAPRAEDSKTGRRKYRQVAKEPRQASRPLHIVLAGILAMIRELHNFFERPLKQAKRNCSLKTSFGLNVMLLLTWIIRKRPCLMATMPMANSSIPLLDCPDFREKKTVLQVITGTEQIRTLTLFRGSFPALSR